MIDEDNIDDEEEASVERVHESEVFTVAPVQPRDDPCGEIDHDQAIDDLWMKMRGRNLTKDCRQP